MKQTVLVVDGDPSCRVALRTCVRGRIERDVSAPELIQTVRTRGYKFRPGTDTTSLCNARMPDNAGTSPVVRPIQTNAR
jgi:hypothetical protein